MFFDQVSILLRKMSDEEDYMSDKFLQGSEKNTSSSLIYRRSDKREFALMKKKIEMKEQNKSIRVVEAEKREEGLSSAITSTNKGLYKDLYFAYILYGYISHHICIIHWSKYALDAMRIFKKKYLFFL